MGGMAALCLGLSAHPAMAGSLLKDGFAFPAGTPVKIAVFRPDVQVGTLRTGGVDEPNADWTAQARTNLQSAFEGASDARDAQMVFLGEPDGENAKLLNDYRALFQIVSKEILGHGVFVDRLPTKKVPGKTGDPVRHNLDWTLGGGAQKLKQVTGADYALFVYTHDSYGSAGRKAAQLFAAALLGVYVAPGVHIGYAGLVDLNTGDMKWFNADIQMGGDPRTTDGAAKRVGELLRNFPKNGTAPAVAVAQAPAAAASTPAAH